MNAIFDATLITLCVVAPLLLLAVAADFLDERFPE